MPKTLMIGDLARETGTKLNTIRFYEDIGLPLGRRGRCPGDAATDRMIFDASRSSATLVRWDLGRQ